MVLPDGRVESCGNFHGAPLAFACDFLAIAVAEVGAIAERRTDRLLDETRSHGLPPFLAEDPGVNSGLMLGPLRAGGDGRREPPARRPGQRRLAADERDAGGSRLDGLGRGSQAAGERSRTSLGSSRSSSTLRARGLDLRAPLAPGPGTGAALAAVRERVAGPGPDRFLAPELAAVEELVGAGGCSARSSPAIGVLAVSPSAAPRGTELSCRGWPQEAAMRMLMNNLDPEVAENPDELVVYGGTGRGGPLVGGVRRDRAHAADARRTTRRCSSSRASRWACSRPTSGRRAC